jgi:ParB family chromosome partitioning protein
MADPNSPYHSDSIFWVEVDRIKPNPFQPRRVFDEAALASLAESIRQYGVLQPLTVTRKEIERPGEGIFVEYELVAGERRLRASKLAGIAAVPVVIRTAEDTDRVKLELAIIENLQREDLNPVDRAIAFQRLAKEFNLKNTEIGVRVGKSREYVSNTLRILALPKEMLDALVAGEISEGHTRPLLMLVERPEEQATLFKDIILRRMNVRDAEQTARRIAVERARKNDLTPELLLLERELTEKLGTRVRIEKKEQGGGKVSIDFFSADDLVNLRAILAQVEAQAAAAIPAAAETTLGGEAPDVVAVVPAAGEIPADVAAVLEQKQEDEDLYSISGFTV